MSLVVKAYHPWRTRLVSGLLLVVLLLVAWALFEYGRYSAGFDSFKARDEHRALLKQTEALQSKHDISNEETVLFHERREV